MREPSSLHDWSTEEHHESSQQPSVMTWVDCQLTLDYFPYGHIDDERARSTPVTN